MRAIVMALVLLVAQGIDLAPLLRKLLDGHDGDKGSTSKAIRLEDEKLQRHARLRLVEEGDSTLVVVELDPAHERLLPHTVELEIDGETMVLRVMELQLSRDRSEPEVVVALLPPSQFEALAGASSAVLTLKGWDETFTASFDDKDLRKVASFYDRRRRSEPVESVDELRRFSYVP